MSKRAQRAKLRRAAMTVHRLIRPAENRYVSGLRAVMRTVHAEYMRALAPHVVDFARKDAKTPNPVVSAAISHAMATAEARGAGKLTEAEYLAYHTPAVRSLLKRLTAGERYRDITGAGSSSYGKAYALGYLENSATEGYTITATGRAYVESLTIPRVPALAPSAQSSSLVASEVDALGLKIQVSLAPSVGPLFDRMATSVRVANKKGQALFGIKSSELGIDGQIRAARDASIRLVEKASRTYAADVRAVFDDPNNHALRVEELQAKLQERADVSESRAELIARDQTLKLNGAITQTRQTNAGVTEYVWSTSLDDRVREEHADLEGQTFSWTSPPEPGHPGEDINCRCVAVPANEDLDKVFA